MNQTVNITKQFGNFNIAVEAVVTDEQVRELLKLGVLYVMERTPSSETEKEVFGKEWEKGSKGGKKRPKDFARTDVPYSAALASEIATVFGSQEAKVPGTKDMALAFEVTSVTEYEGGETGTSRKLATAFVEAQLANIGKLAEEKKDLARSILYTTLGIEDGVEPGFDDLVEAAHKTFFAKKK